MDAWQALRLKRANDHDICITRVDCTDDSICISVQGLSDDYIVEVNADVSLWPPTCNCEGNFWRSEFLCKHIMLCLLLMGVRQRDLKDCGWQPQQDELNAILSNAPECFGVALSSG